MTSNVLQNILIVFGAEVIIQIRWAYDIRQVQLSHNYISYVPPQWTTQTHHSGHNYQRTILKYFLSTQSYTTKSYARLRSNGNYETQIRHGCIQASWHPAGACFSTVMGRLKAWTTFLTSKSTPSPGSPHPAAAESSATGRPLRSNELEQTGGISSLSPLSSP